MRQSLPVPFAPVMGAVPVSREGIAIGAELADGLRGQEMQRTELTGVVLSGGVENLVGATLSGLRTSDDHIQAVNFRVKIRVARPTGPKSALAVLVGSTSGKRVATPAQDERLQTFEAALPFEVLATPERKVWLSAFVAPRIMVERYTDRLTPSQSLTATFVGGSSGFHLRAWFVDLFSELTVARVPATVYQGVSYPRSWYAFPAVSLMLRFGTPYLWAKP